MATLAYEVDLEIGINVGYTILSAVLAVSFTFVALGSDILWEAYKRDAQRQRGLSRKKQSLKGAKITEREVPVDNDTRPLLQQSEEYTEHLARVENADEFARFDAHQKDLAEDEESIPFDVENQPGSSIPEGMTFDHAPARICATCSTEEVLSPRASGQNLEPTLPERPESTAGFTDSSDSRRSRSLFGSSPSSYGLSNVMNTAYQSASPTKNVFKATAETLYTGFTYKNTMKGFLWSLAITTMHWAGLKALSIPEGFLKLNYMLVILSAIISWCVCVVGCILMPQSSYSQPRPFLLQTSPICQFRGLRFLFYLFKFCE